MTRFSALLAAALLIGPAAAGAEEAATSKPPFSAEETQAIGEIVREYLLANPQVLLESLQQLEEREKQAKADAQREAIQARLADLVDDPQSPVIGNPDGDVTLVEFFDYRCTYCRRMAVDLLEGIEKDGRVRLVMKEFPILGPESLLASRAALAASLQGRYEDFHMALMTAPGQMDETLVFEVAADSGLDVERLKADMQADWIAAEINKNRALAEALQIEGTPAFVVDGDVIPGAVPVSVLLMQLAEERAKAG